MKPLLTIDLETTGTNVATDAIVQLGIYSPFVIEREWLIKPWKPIPPEATKVHGITNEWVENCPTFEQVAPDVLKVLTGVDLLGFNLTNFDVPLLWEELYRCGIEWDLTGVNIIDAGTIMKRKEERTLSAAVKFYCGREHVGAHGALADCIATSSVFTAQVIKYGLTSIGVTSGRDCHAELARYSVYDEERLTLDGKIIKGPDGEPVYNFGKQKGVKVKDDPGFGYWMLAKDFPGAD